MTAEVLAEHRVIWETKPVLRAVYTNYYRKIVSWSRDTRGLMTWWFLFLAGLMGVTITNAWSLKKRVR